MNRQFFVLNIFDWCLLREFVMNNSSLDHDAKLSNVANMSLQVEIQLYCFLLSSASLATSMTPLGMML